MRKLTVLLFCALTMSLAVTPPVQNPAQREKSLVGLFPAGPLLYLEARDFSALLRDWNSSVEKQRWLASDNYRVFSRSRLFLRLADMQNEYAAAAGVPPDMPLTESLAGAESALALYDIGNLEFLYLTRMPAARARENALWRTRDQFEPRRADGVFYYLRTDPSKRRVAAFALTEDYLVVATREDLLVGCLRLLSGKQGSTLETETWFRNAVRSAGPQGDLRLALNLAALTRASHFRAYWIQQNVSELRQYASEIADVYRSSSEIREERTLLRLATDSLADTTSEEPARDDAALQDIVRLVPASAALYRAWANPPLDRVEELLRRKILAPGSTGVPPSKLAPQVTLSEEEVGSEADLETPIDLAPLERTVATLASDALRKWLEGKQLVAALHVQSSQPVTGGVFLTTPSVLVLAGAQPWDAVEARQALLDALGDFGSISRLGMTWTERQKGQSRYHVLAGLGGIAVAVEGHYGMVGNSAGLVESVLDRLSSPAGAARGTYAAGFRHAQERENLIRLTRLMETPFLERWAEGEPEAREPRFFSENLASLCQSLARVEATSIVVRDRGNLVSQTATYRLGQ
jgi:hypothetical protein